MMVTLINCPYFRNIIFDLFETLVVFEESICFVGVVNVRIVFPFDMESLEDDDQESVKDNGSMRLTRLV